MIAVKNKADCCGCGACVSACPKKCLTLQADGEGFVYPQLDKQSCINCGLCERVCPLLHKPQQHELFGVYGAKNKDDVTRFFSSSGGMFTLLAEKILTQGGAVFGAVLDEKLQVRHICVQESSGLARLRGSKYVQSIMGACYAEARNLLQQGSKVLFSGTPCQIAGLKGFLQRGYDNLLTVDVVCHGVPSPKVYAKHLAELAELAGELVREVRFRDKEKGWLRGETLFLTEHRRFGASKRKETYMRLFLNNISIRPSCGQCAFNNRRSLADITIADYWGVNKQFPEFDDDKGVTLVLINTPQGQEMLEAVSGSALLLASDFAKGAEYNQAVAKSLPLHPRREFFFASLEKYTLPELAQMLLDAPQK